MKAIKIKSKLLEKKIKNYRIFITGGHSTPAVACINELKSRGFNNLIYIGQKKSLLFDKNNSSEFKLITEDIHIPFKSIIAGKFSLFRHWHSIIWFLRLPIGFIQALYYQIFYRPRLILTFGSHVALPIVLIGWLFRTPIISHEQTITVGRSNLFIRKFASKICYSWQEIIFESDKKKQKKIHSKFNNSKYIYTGNPIRDEIIHAKTSVISKLFKFRKTKKNLFITGGNQGAHAINEFIFKNLNKLILKYNIIHQTGSNTIYDDYSKALEFQKKYGQYKYKPHTYLLSKEMANAYSDSDVIISRGGANTTCEMLYLKKKSIIIPIPTTSGNEQFLQGKILEDFGLAKVIDQSDLNDINIDQLLETVSNLKIKDKDLLKIAGNLHKNAQKRIVDIVENKLRKLDI